MLDAVVLDVFASCLYGLGAAVRDQ